MIDEIGGDIAKQYRLTYKSPRSSYDGTTRDIAITVGGKTGEGAFLEPHLINIQSSLPIFLGLLAVLLLSLTVPAWFGRRPARWRSQQPQGCSPRRSRGAGYSRKHTCSGMLHVRPPYPARRPLLQRLRRQGSRKA